MKVQIEKIKLSKNEPMLCYSRYLGDGKTEQCKLELFSPPEELKEAIQALREDAIEIIGLDVERWNKAEIIGLSLKWSGTDLGFTTTLLNKDTESGEVLAITANTPYMKPDLVSYDQKQRLLDICRIAQDYIESQPVQAELELQAA